MKTHIVMVPTSLKAETLISELTDQKIQKC